MIALRSDACNVGVGLKIDAAAGYSGAIMGAGLGLKDVASSWLELSGEAARSLTSSLASEV